MARAFLTSAAHRLHLPPRELSPADEAALLAYDFPGNVRELQNVIERAVVLAKEGSMALGLHLGRSVPLPLLPEGRVTDPGELLSDNTLREMQRRNVLLALERCRFKIAGDSGAAKLLGISPSTLAYRMKQLGIERPR